MNNRRQIKLENLFLILATIAIFAFIVVFPINRLPDEMNHARMAWETFHKPSASSFQWMDEVAIDAHNKPAEYQQIFSQKLDMTKEPYQFGVSLKSISFIPQIIGMTIGSWISPSVGVIVYMGRIFNALAYILGVYFLIRYFRYGKLALVFISLLPIMIQQAASLSYDVMNYLEIMTAVGFITNLAYTKRFTNRHLLQVIGISILLLATKPNNVLLLGLIPFLPLQFEGVLEILNRPYRASRAFVYRFKYIFYALALVLVVLILKFLLKNDGGLLHYGQVLLNTLVRASENGDLNSILTIGMFGYFGNFTLQLPLWLVFIDVAVLGLVFIAEEKDYFSKDFADVSALLFPIQVLATVTVMYLQWTPIVLGHGANISVGAQGRYFTPFLILLLPVVANLGKLDISKNRLLNIVVGIIIVNILISLYLIIPYYWVLRG